MQYSISSGNGNVVVVVVVVVVTNVQRTRISNELDAGESRTLARPAAPLAAFDRNQQQLVATATFLGRSKKPNF